MVEPRERQMKLGEQRRHQNGKTAKCDRHARRQSGGRHRDRGDEQKGERVLESSGQIKERSKLEDIVAEHQEGVVVRQALARRIAQAKRDVEPGRQRDHRKAGADRQIDAHEPIDDDHRCALAEHGEPAQPDDGLQAQPAFTAAEQIPAVLGARCRLTNVRGAHS